ncbi:MAG: 5-oxoprolinase/urea amidolyase family protein [Anaerolineae bacterium]
MLHVIEPGFQTTVQDLGRPGLAEQGISPAGPMDAVALRLGNLIVGNGPDAAALEITLTGPTLRCDADTVVALVGAPFDAHIEGEPVGSRQPSTTGLPPWQATRIPRGSSLRIGPARAGMRGYLCVAGGVTVEPTLGSRATHLMARLGGLDGRALQAGDTLPVGEPPRPLADLVGRRLRRALWPTYPQDAVARAILGPQADRFTDDARAAFLNQPYRVEMDSNRMGVRLAGPRLTHTRGADLLSEGIGLGAIQVPNSGQPIILMVERQTTGGYTKIATVISADIGVVGQARPGSQLRFREVSLDEAVAARRAQEELVSESSIEAGPAWGPAEIAAVIETFAASGLGEMRLHAGGVRLLLRRDSGTGAGETAEEASPRPDSHAHAPPGQVVITAPLLGVFYAAPTADAPPYVQPGDAVDKDAVVGLIDVMKTLHQVRAPRAGRVTAVLTESGALVEYGQPLMTLEAE